MAAKESTVAELIFSSIVAFNGRHDGLAENLLSLSGQNPSLSDYFAAFRSAPQTHPRTDESLSSYYSSLKAMFIRSRQRLNYVANVYNGTELYTESQKAFDDKMASIREKILDIEKFFEFWTGAHLEIDQLSVTPSSLPSVGDVVGELTVASPSFTSIATVTVGSALEVMKKK